MINDTIVALSTAPMTSAIGVIRMSGSKSFDILRKIFNKNIPDINCRSSFVGKIIDNNDVIDEVVAILYKSPNSFTGEDIVEINCHGSVLLEQRIIELCIKNGARQADHGEFSKKAFYNGKLDLIQAESINDLILANTFGAQKLAMQGLNGATSGKLIEVKTKLVEILAQIQVNVDYPEYEDIEQLTNTDIIPKINNLLLLLEKQLKNTKIGMIIKDGVKVAIIGKPNAGKSSILNAMLGEEKAIVTNIAGTTRDVVEGTFSYKGIKYNLLDTAGLRESKDQIEQIGIQKSINAIDESDLIIHVFDGSISEADNLIDDVFIPQNKPIINVVNKSDILADSYKNYVKTCAKSRNISDLLEKMNEMVGVDMDSVNDYAMLCNSRQLGLIEKSYNCLKNSLDSIKNGFSIDIVSIDLQEALNAINDILGANSKEDLDNEIFAKFCIGK